MKDLIVEYFGRELPKKDMERYEAALRGKKVFLRVEEMTAINAIRKNAKHSTKR